MPIIGRSVRLARERVGSEAVIPRAREPTTTCDGRRADREDW